MMRVKRLRPSQLAPVYQPLAAEHYLTVTEVADLLGKSRQWVHDQVEAEQLPALRVGTNVRVEAEAIIRGAPCALPRLQTNWIRLSWAAAHLRVSVWTMRRLAKAGEVPFTRRGKQGHYGCTRVAFTEWVMAQTTGDQAVEGGGQ